MKALPRKESTAYTFRFTSAGQTDRHVGLWITKQLCGVILGIITTDHLEFGLLLIFAELFVCLPWVSQLGIRKFG